MTLTKKGEYKEHQLEVVGIYPKSAISWYMGIYGILKEML